MTEPIWNQFLSERDKQVFGTAGYGARQGFGKRPAVLIIDVNYNFCGEKPEPILESIKRWRNSCGEDAWDGIKAIQKLLVAARAKDLPVIYSTGTRREDNWDAGSWSWKNSRNGERVSTEKTKLDGNTIVAEIGPQPQDIVIAKLKPSVFHGTPLHSFLTLLGADSLLVCGTTTSGCVRATVVDAFSDNYRVTLVEEGCFDRSQASHALSLCDMHAKYADVEKLEKVVAFVNTLPRGLFDLPGAKRALERAA
jgi:maleamate amidohydrolase